MVWRRLTISVLLIVGMAVHGAGPAQATSALTVAVAGRMIVGNGIAYPCLDGKGPGPVPVVNLAKCVPLVNTAYFNLVADGVGGIGKALTPKCGASAGCFGAGIFQMNAIGVVAGHCGFSTGQGAGTISGGTIGTKPGSSIRPYTFVWLELGGVLIVTGTYNGTGVLTGALVAVPDPFAGAGCLNKAPKPFIFAGGLVFAD